MDLPLVSRLTPGPRTRRAWEVLAAVYREVRTENLTFMAGSIAYHAFVSLLPLLVLLLVALESVGGGTLTEAVLLTVEAVFSPSGRDLVVDTVRRAATVSGTSVVGVAVLVWATLRIFRGFDQAFSDIYETERTNDFLDQVRDGALVLAVAAAAVGAAAGVRTVLVFGPGPVGTALQTGFVVAALTAALFPMYYVFPDVDLRVVEVLPGTVLAAVGLTALESLFRVYVALSSTGETYGVIGSVVVLVTWLYFNGLVLLLGVVVNAVLTNRTADVAIEPVIGDYRVGLAVEDRPDRDAMAERLSGVEASAESGEVVSVLVDGRRVRVPPPEAVVVEDDGETVWMTLEW
jgi:membrane protein